MFVTQPLPSKRWRVACAWSYSDVFVLSVNYGELHVPGVTVMCLFYLSTMNSSSFLEKMYELE
jgi:hypothetical protein